MDNNYLDMMIQSLQKKVRILDGIIEKNKEQQKILEQEELDADAFEENVKSKSELVDRKSVV